MKTEELEKLIAKATPLPWKLTPLWDESGLTANKIDQDCQPGCRFKSDTTEICRFPEAIQNRENARLIDYAANNIFRVQCERDEAVAALIEALPWVEAQLDDPVNKKGAVRGVISRMRSTISKIEKGQQ